MGVGVTYWIALWIFKSGTIVALSQFVSGSSELLLSGHGEGEAGVASYHQPLSWSAVSHNPSIPVAAVPHTKLGSGIIHCRKTVCHMYAFVCNANMYVHATKIR